MRLLVQSAVVSGEPYAIDYRVCLPNGDERIFRIPARWFRDDQGTPIRTAGTVQDVTELRRQGTRRASAASSCVRSSRTFRAAFR